MKYLVLGHSHPARAFNDTLIDNLYNFGKEAESYFYTYYKTKEIIKINKQIKVVFIEFSNNQILENCNQWIWGENDIYYRYPKYAPYIDFEGNFILLKNNFKSFISVQNKLLNSNIDIIKKCDYNLKLNKNFLGHYLYSKENKFNNIRKSKFENKTQLSTTNIYFLQKLIDLCILNNIKIYLIRSPLHPNYIELNNELTYKKIRMEKFKKIEFLDFKDFSLNNEDYINEHHLNYKGAIKFSVFFNSMLKKGLLNAKRKQNFIDLEMSKINNIEKN